MTDCAQVKKSFRFYIIYIRKQALPSVAACFLNIILLFIFSANIQVVKIRYKNDRQDTMFMLVDR